MLYVRRSVWLVRLTRQIYAKATHKYQERLLSSYGNTPLSYRCCDPCLSRSEKSRTPPPNPLFGNICCEQSKSGLNWCERSIDPHPPGTCTLLTEHGRHLRLTWLNRVDLYRIGLHGWSINSAPELKRRHRRVSGVFAKHFGDMRGWAGPQAERGMFIKGINILSHSDKSEKVLECARQTMAAGLLVYSHLINTLSQHVSTFDLIELEGLRKNSCPHSTFCKSL